MKRGAAAGSVLAFFAFLLLRGSPAVGPGAAEVLAQSEHIAAVRAAELLHPSSSKPWPEEGPWEASRRHFAGKLPEGECPVSMARGESAREKQWCIPPQEQARAMIAIVPDPVHSHMSLVFDRSVEALQLAAQSMKYVMDDYWLPWDPASPSDEREAQPGLVMFRWNGKTGEGPASLLYVFLVADTSTAGINGSQFNHAVDYVQKICAEPGKLGSGCGNSGKIWILGPTFSGSLESLRRLTGAKNPLNFTAYSGTVSSLCAIYNQGLLEEGVLPNGPLPDCMKRDGQEKIESIPSENRPLNLRFRSLVNDTETAVITFVDFLEKSKSIDCGGYPEVAIFSEAATTYGAAGGSRYLKRRKGGKAEDTAQSSSDESACKLDSFSYPREISNLRNAYQKGISQTSAANNPGTAQNSLPFDLTDRQPNKSDEPPDFSMQQGPLSKEAVLMQFALQLRRQHYKYIGIIGSNVLDVLFLTNFLRSASPDTRLFVLNSDLMFERQMDNAPYIGMLAITSYPLLGRNLNWTGGQISPLECNPLSNCNANQASEWPAALKYLPFADQYEEGQYNAALLVMEQVVPPHCSKGNCGLVEFSEPFAKSPSEFDPQSTRLPLWLTVVGTGGYWPIQILSPDSDPSDVASKQLPVPELEDMDFSPGWQVVTLLLCTLAFLHIFVLWIAPNVKSRFRDFALGSAGPGQRLFFINVASAGLAVALAMLASPAWHLSSQEGRPVLAIAFFIAPLAILGLLLICLWLNFGGHGIGKKAKEGEQAEASPLLWSRIVACGVWFLTAAGGWAWVSLMRDDQSHYGFFFAYRTVNLATGVSPFAPLLPLFAAMYCWCIFEIWRLRFHDHVRPRLNVSNGFAGARSETCIAASVNRYFLDGSYAAVFSLALALWLGCFHPWRPFWLFEKPAFTVLYSVLLCILVLLTLSGGLRLLQIWSRLRRLLRELEWSPVRLAFSRLNVGSWSPIWESGGQEVEWTNMARSFEVMQQISNCSSGSEFKKTPTATPALENALKDAIKAAMDKRDELRRQLPGTTMSSDQAAGAQMTGKETGASDGKQKSKDPSEIFQAMEKHFGDLQEKLAEVLNASLNILQGYWQTHCSEGGDELERDEKQVIVYCQPEKTDEQTRQMQRLEEYVALRYMTLIRCVLGHIKHLLILLVILFSLALISLNVYSFEPHQSLVWSFTGIFAIIGLIVLVILTQVHKDPVLSRITGTKPNELGFDFYYRIASLGAVPLFTLLATHFPAIGQYLSSLFQPGSGVLK